MKTIKFLSVLFTAILLYSCSSIRVDSDFDKEADFSSFKTYAFYKNGIDKVEISDLDKKRILKAIDETMLAKGFTKSENPDMLINIFTKERKEVNINQFNSGWGYGWRWGWNPWMWGGYTNTSVSQHVEGTLYIDIINAQKKEMIWQGKGEGILTQNQKKKEEKIQEFVTKILAQYPPQTKK